MRKMILLAVVLTLAPPALAQTLQQGTMKSGARLTFPGAGNAGPFDLHSSNRLGDCTGPEWCCKFNDPPNDCDSLQGGDYNGGDTACFSDSWSESFEVEQEYWVSWTHVYLLPGGGILPIFLDLDVGFGVVPAGDFSFCVAYAQTLPEPGAMADIDTGLRVISKGGTGGPQVTGSFTVNP